MIAVTILLLIFFGTTGGLYMGFVSLNDATDMYPAAKTEQTPQLILLAVFATIGAVLTYLAKRKVDVFDDYIVRIIAFGGAAMGVFLIVVGISMPGWAKYACMIVGGIVGIYLVKGNEDQI